MTAPTLTFSIDDDEWVRGIEALEMPVVEKLGNIADAIGAETVAYLRSLTNEMRPPARKGEAPRQAHPGHWADVTGQLAASYALADFFLATFVMSCRERNKRMRV